jgi:MFS family permease
MSYFGFIKTNLRWLLGGFLLTMFSSFGQTFYIALSTGHIRQAFNLTSGEYGSIYMIATLASAILFPFVGQIVDKYSVVKVVTITVIGLAIACLALAKSQSVFLLVLALFGLRLFGQGMMTHISITAMGRWYAENRGKSISIASLGFSAGQAFLPVTFVALVAIVGWRDAWIVAAITMLIVALPSITALMWVERVPMSEVSDDALNSVRQWSRAEMLRDPLFWIANIGILAPPFISTAIFFHQDFLLSSRGWSIELFALTFVWMTIVTVLSSLVSGWAVDRTSAVKLLPIFLVPMALGCLVLAFIHAEYAIVLFMTFLGISSGMIAILYGALWPEVYGTTNLGSIRSLVTALMVLFSALGPGVIGWLIDFGVSLDSQFLGMAIYMFVASLALIYCSREYDRRKLEFEYSKRNLFA